MTLENGKAYCRSLDLDPDELVKGYEATPYGPRFVVKRRAEWYKAAVVEPLIRIVS